MFQSVRPNSQIFIFHKGDSPLIETGYVVNQPIPRAKYQLPSVFGQPQEMVVDLIVKVGEHTVNYNNLPAQADVSDSLSNGESIIITDNREAMNAEILNLRQKSMDIVNSVEYNKNLIDKYDAVLLTFNPELAEKEEHKKEIDALKTQMAEMATNINALMESNRSLIEQLTERKN